MTTKDKLSKLDGMIDRPEQGPAKRHMIACEPEAYAFITELAEKLDTTRNKVISALVKFYDKAN